jgi:hypothetical protein
MAATVADHGMVDNQTLRPSGFRSVQKARTPLRVAMSRACVAVAPGLLRRRGFDQLNPLSVEVTAKTRCSPST